MMKLDTLLGKNKSLKEACENLQTILGIGKTTAVILLAEIPDINAFKNARQLAAYAGLTPSQRFSGSSVKGKLRLSKLGARQLRKAMFFPAFVAKRYNEPIKQFCKNLKKKGKYTFCIVGTAMRKLLQIVFVILKRDVVFNPSLI
ncbi:MAG: IS110 family transposase [Rickettsiales bacterium]|jgi:transposase|nr:IS110 family transposase [Rickettsiales bacterium]